MKIKLHLLLLSLFFLSGLLVGGCKLYKDSHNSSSGGGVAAQPITPIDDVAALSGDWSGQSPVGHSIKFKVRRGYIINYDVNPPCVVPSSQIRSTTIEPGIQIISADKSFSLSGTNMVFKGSFNSATTVTGTVQYTHGSACDDATPVSWNATRVTAVPVGPQFKLDVNVNLSGLIMTNPQNDFACNSIPNPNTDTYSDQCSGLFDQNSRVMLLYPALDPYYLLELKSWGGDCKGLGPCEVLMDAPKNVTATFGLIKLDGIYTGKTTNNQDAVLKVQNNIVTQIDLDFSNGASDPACKFSLTNSVNLIDSGYFSVDNGIGTNGYGYFSPTDVFIGFYTPNSLCNSYLYGTLVR